MRNINDNRFMTFLAMPELNEKSVKQARRLMRGYKSQGILLEGTFDADEWLMSDEYATYTFRYELPDFYTKYYCDRLSISEEEMKKLIKTFIVFHLGSLSLATLREFLFIVRSIFCVEPDDIINISENSWVLHAERINDFLSMIPFKNKKAEDTADQISAAFDEKIEYDELMSIGRSKTNQRRLRSFDSYFRFNEIINKFWMECTDVEEKLFYFPVILWWKITAVLPTRPREFVLTPKECLKKTADGYKIILRKNRIKGAGKKKTYRIAGDYRMVEYPVSSDIASLILWYQEKTKGDSKNEIDTLFTVDSHYAKWGYGRKSNSRYYTYTNLSTCLRYFYKNIICDQYGYRLLFEDSDCPLKDDEIQYINLGDSRHLAMINLIAEGATPVIVMMLAGHDNPEMSAHYYSNISTLIKCRTYRAFKSLTNNDTEYSIASFSGPLKATASYVTINSEGDRCYSPNFCKDNFSDCFKVGGPNGEIGYCQKCTYFRKGGHSFENSSKDYEREIKNKCDLLKEVVAKVRANKGEPEEIGEVLLQIRACENSYEQYINEMMAEGKEV